MEIELTAPAIPQMRIRTALAETEQVIRSHSRTFYFATGLLPLEARRAIRVLYGFCRATDDLVDRKDATSQELERWREQVNLEPEQQSDPLLLSWALVRKHYQIDRRYEQELIDGVRMDLVKARYATWTDLENYCYHVASTVGLLSIPVIGLARGATFEQAARYAIRLGIALQLTNVLRDVGEDAENGRVYLPDEDLARFGLSRQDILDRVFDERFVALMKFEIERAREIYRQALPGIALLSPAARPSVGAAALLYREILNEIERNDYRVYQIRVHTSGRKKLAMLPGILAAVWSLKRPED